MNTPAHAIANLLIQGHNQPPKIVFAIALGAMLPDFSMIVFYAWQKLVLGTPEMTIWREKYWLPQWQAVFDGFHSIPIALALAAIAWLAKAPVFVALWLSMALHALFDLPVHHDDGHRHFFPLSDWKFDSPVSYWHPNHHGRAYGAFEMLLMIGGSAFLLWRHKAKLSRWVIGALLAIYFSFLVFAIVMWVLPNS